MQRPTPTFLRLYPDAISRGDGISRLLKKRTGQADPRLLSYFAFKNDERRFAISLLERHARFWLFRTHQGRFAGDFVAVDMSERRVARRNAWCIDLKRGDTIVAIQAIQRRQSIADTNPAKLVCQAVHRAITGSNCPASVWSRREGG